MNEKKILDWETVMLDTSIIISLFLSEKPDTNDDNVQFIRELIDYLNNSSTGSGKPRRFLVSSIVISELLTKENDQEKIKKVLKVLNSGNVEFVDFNLEASLLFNAHLHPYLSKKILHKFAIDFGFKSNDFMMAREWISRDFMIVMSGVENNADVILTADHKTFYPLAQKANAFCALSKRYLFDKPHKSVLDYYHKQAQTDFIK